jgi:hypothetical protein
MGVHCTVHETPRKCESVYQHALRILVDHKVAENPDKNDTEDIGDHTGFIANPIHDLSHH